MWPVAEDKALDGYAAESVGRKEELSLFCSQVTLDPVWELLNEVTVNRVRNEIRIFFSATTNDCAFNSGKQLHKQTSGPLSSKNQFIWFWKGFLSSCCAIIPLGTGRTVEPILLWLHRVGRK